MRDSVTPNDRRAVLAAAVAAAGLAPRGVVRLGPDDGVEAFADGRPAAAALLVGWRGRIGWDAFAASPERRDGRPDPLDRWSVRVIGAIAAAFGGRAVFPFEGPPHRPFQRWAARAEGLASSPLGLSIDGEVGLWHGFRGAIVTAEDLGGEASPQASPCETCASRPCLSACPAGAFSATGYDVAACRGFLESHAGGLCRTDGCRARDACPVGRRHRYGPEQIRFLMRAFRASLLETTS
ncbi:MAG: ferredoxin [Hyphomicrobiales bacterium]|nr:ferredoxin [Hyphomicrobiales bacterium]